MAKWVRSIRTGNDLEQVEFASLIGKSRSAVAMYESGAPIPADVVSQILEAFPGANPPPMTGDVQVTGPALSDELYRVIKYAGTVPCSSDWGDPLSSSDSRPIDPKFAGKNRFLAKVVGDSCYPALQQGDLTVWETDNDPPYGVIVLAERNEDHACTVKELVYDDQAGRARLNPVNKRYEAPPDDGGWRVIARLVGVLRTTDGPERTWYWPAGLRPRHLGD